MRGAAADRQERSWQTNWVSRRLARTEKYMCLALGVVAPDFELPVVFGGDTVRLEDYKGKNFVVILLPPLAFSSACTSQMCSVAENYSRWEELGAEVIGISTDSPYVNQKFAEECGASFPIASDDNKIVSSEYKGLLEEVIETIEGGGLR
ncbi:MAG TPA: redoxin domain-containing protein [Gemmatimonadetes bacterium]|nr:redoxin domain-containing protein [Gemmatimonadota bacterium]